MLKSQLCSGCECCAASNEGMQLNNSLLQLIGLRFADDNYDIDFDDYLTCIVRLENMFSTLKINDAPMLNLWVKRRLTDTFFSVHQEFLKPWTQTRGDACE